MRVCVWSTKEAFLRADDGSPGRMRQIMCERVLPDELLYHANPRKAAITVRPLDVPMTCDVVLVHAQCTQIEIIMVPL